MMTIYRLADGKYAAEVRIQDGTESCGTHDTEEEAVQACFQGMEVLNHAKRNSLKRSNIDFRIVIDEKQKRKVFRLWNWKSKRYLDQSDFKNLTHAEMQTANLAGWTDLEDVRAFIARFYNADTRMLCRSVSAECIDIVLEETRIEEALTLQSFVTAYLKNECKTKAEIEAELKATQAREKELKDKLERMAILEDQRKNLPSTINCWDGIRKANRRRTIRP